MEIGDWSEALDVQTALIGALYSREGREYLEEIEARPEETKPPVPGMEQYVYNEREYLDAAVEELRRADPIYVSREVIDLVDVAAETFEPEPIRAADFFATRGFAYFAAPFYRRDTGEGPLAYQAAQWVVGDEDVLAAFYMPTPMPFGGSRLIINGAIRVPLGARPANTDDPLLRLAVFLRFAQQRILSRRSERAARATRRRARGVVGPDEVVVVQLRKAERKQGDDAGSPVDWTHRWMVEGHWRWQWYPSEKCHRQLWIAPYVKGPDDKPFVPKRRAFEVVR